MWEILGVREALDATSIYLEERPRVVECMRSLESYGEDIMILTDIGEQFEGHGGVHAFENSFWFTQTGSVDVFLRRSTSCTSTALSMRPWRMEAAVMKTAVRGVGGPKNR